jgi:hypothetical protein
MGAYSSLVVTRSRALAVVRAEYPLRKALPKAFDVSYHDALIGRVRCLHCGEIRSDIQDEDLEHLLDVLLEPQMLNSVIVPDGTEENDDRNVLVV